MNKVLITIAISVILLVSTAKAEELPSPRILPDHPFYPVKTFLEKVRLWLTFDSEAKARFRIFLAEQRLAELNAMIAKNKWQYVEKLKEEYEKEVNETEKETNKTFGLGRNATTLLEHICNETYKHITVLERILSKVPEAARPGLERAIEASIRGHEKCLERMEKLLNATNYMLRERVCTSDSECINLSIWCPMQLNFKLHCFIPENKTKGVCVCGLPWEKKKINCTDDSECFELVCPMIIGNDTPVCLNGRCTCGAKWQIRNRSEWEKRFREEFTNITWDIQEKIRERVEREIRKRGG